VCVCVCVCVSFFFLLRHTGENQTKVTLSPSSLLPFLFLSLPFSPNRHSLLSFLSYSLLCLLISLFFLIPHSYLFLLRSSSSTLRSSRRPSLCLLSLPLSASLSFSFLFFSFSPLPYSLSPPPLPSSPLSSGRTPLYRESNNEDNNNNEIIMIVIMMAMNAMEKSKQKTNKVSIKEYDNNK